MISVQIHYRGEKVRRFNEWQDDPYRYLDAFVNDDLQALGLPPPHTCACTWRSGIMKCMWGAEEGSELERSILEKFEMIRSNPQWLESLSMSIFSLYADGRRMYVPAPGMRAPPDAKFRPTLRATSMSDVGGPSRAPTSISTARAAASPMASRLSGRVTAQQSALSSHLHEIVPPPRPRIKHEEGALDSTIHVLHEQWPHPSLSTDGSPGIQHGLPAKPSVTFGSRMSIAVPPSPTSSAMSVRTSVTPLHPEPYQSVSGPGRERTAPGGHVSALSMREKELAHALAERGAHSHASSSATAIEERNTMESEIASLRSQVAEEMQARHAAELALRQEQHRRESAEATLDDIRRQCTAPFVVPSLVEAYAEISRLTGELVSARTTGIN